VRNREASGTGESELAKQIRNKYHFKQNPGF